MTFPRQPQQSSEQAPQGEAEEKVIKHSERLYVDETKTTFFRRLCYSPCGTLIFTPAGQFSKEDGTESNAVYVYRASNPAV